MIEKLFSRHSFLIILAFVFVLPIMTRGARYALKSNENNVQDWLPKEYTETQEFQWFKKHFDNETFVLVTWEGCTANDQRLELFARKAIPDPNDIASDALFRKIETTKSVLDRMQAPPLSLSEEECKRRLKGLFVGADGEQACSVLTLTEFGKKDLRKTLDRLYGICCKELGMPRNRVKMGGPPVDNVAISTEGERTLIRLFIPAGIVGISLAYWCLRSVRLTTMVFATALYGACVCLSMVWYSGNALNAIMLTMPAVIYVAGVSGAIHFANYYRDSAVEDGVEGAAARAVKHAWLPCILSAGTTAAGLLSLYTSELMPIKMFGLFSALGVIATLALLFLFLPAWMQVWPMKQGSLLDGNAPKAEELGLSKRWRSILGGVLTYHRPIFGACIVLMFAAGYGLTKVNTSIKLTKLFSEGAEILTNYAWLEDKLGPLVPMEVVIRIDNKNCDLSMLERCELISRIQHDMEKINGIGNTMSVVTYAPSLDIKRAGPFINKKQMRNILNKKLEDHREEYLATDFLKVSGDEELWRISARVGALNDIDYGEFQTEMKACVEPLLTKQRENIEREAKRTAGKIKPVAYAEPIELAQAPTMETMSGDTMPNIDLPAVESPPAAAAASNDTRGISATYTGLVPLVYKAQRSMLNGLAWNFVTDVLTISAVMCVVFADFAAGLVLLIPSIFPLVVVFGIMGWCGVLIDVGTIMTPTVALGVSVDDVVHFLIWYRTGLSQGKSRRDSVMLAYEGCARAMYQSWSVLGLGLAVFSLSTFVPTQRFGAMMFALLTAALIGNLVLLPCVLQSPIGWLFLWSLRRKVAKNPEKYAAEHQAAHEKLSTEHAIHPAESIPTPSIVQPPVSMPTVTSQSVAEAFTRIDSTAPHRPAPIAPAQEAAKKPRDFFAT